MLLTNRARGLKEMLLKTAGPSHFVSTQSSEWSDLNRKKERDLILWVKYKKTVEIMLQCHKKTSLDYNLEP